MQSKMKIAIHKNQSFYTRAWEQYCINHHLDYKMVNAYDSDIISQLWDIDIFLWHFHQLDYRDMLLAKPLLISLEQAGKIVFPNTATGWHFDDKLAEKYLFESLGVLSAKGYAFYTKADAVKWAKDTTYPKVFKLRGGAGSSNVRLAHNYKEAKRLIDTAFSNKGYPAYQPWEQLKRAIKSIFNGDGSNRRLLASLYHCFVPIKQYQFLPIQNGYIYFQDFIPNDGFDYRLEITGNKAIALVRYCRKNDFRASGGHNDHFEHELIPNDVIQFGFNTMDRLGMQSAALDIVRDNRDNKLYLIEVSYCYGVDNDEFEHGYWTRDGIWHDEPFNGIDWIIESIIDIYKQRNNDVKIMG